MISECDKTESPVPRGLWRETRPRKTFARGATKKSVDAKHAAGVSGVHLIDALDHFSREFKERLRVA